MNSNSLHQVNEFAESFVHLRVSKKSIDRFNVHLAQVSGSRAEYAHKSQSHVEQLVVLVRLELRMAQFAIAE
jgi:hypothetical protein